MKSISEQHHEKALKMMPGGVSSPVRAFKGVGGTPLVFDRGEGAYLIDMDQKRYLDYVLSWGPLILGHAYPGVVEALLSAARKGTSFGATCALEIELAERLIGCFDSIDQLRFVNSGTEATMSVLRVARGFTGRDKIIKFDGGFHGHSDMLLSKAGSGLATLGVPDSAGVPNASTQNTLTAAYNSLEEVEGLFAAHKDQIAAVIIEPIAGNMGFVRPKAGFLEGLRILCTQHGALLIFDEVMTGFRVAYPSAQALFDVRPDLTCLGKVIGGGLPVGAYGGRADIMAKVAPLGPVYQSGTLSGNPIGMAAGLATLSALDTPGVFDKATASCKKLVLGLRAAAHAHGIPMQSDYSGTMFGFCFLKEEGASVFDYTSAKRHVDTKRYASFFHAMLQRGFYFAPSAFEAGFLSSAHSDEGIDETLLAVNEVFLSWR